MLEKLTRMIHYAWSGMSHKMMFLSSIALFLFIILLIIWVFLWLNLKSRRGSLFSFDMVIFLIISFMIACLLGWVFHKSFELCAYTWVESILMFIIFWFVGVFHENVISNIDLVKKNCKIMQLYILEFFKKS